MNGTELVVAIRELGGVNRGAARQTGPDAMTLCVDWKGHL